MGSSFTQLRQTVLLAVVSRVGYASMRLMEPWTGYEVVRGIRLLACNEGKEESLNYVHRALEALSEQDPATLTELQERIRYIFTVDEGEWSHRVLEQMRVLRWNISNLRTTRLDQQVALLRGVAAGEA